MLIFFKDEKNLIKNKQRVFVIVIFLFIVALPCMTAKTNAVPNKVTYTQSQIDSIIFIEVQKHIDTQLIDLKIQNASNDILKTYISEENNHLSLLAIILTLFTAIVGVLVPIYINKWHEKLIDERLKDNKAKIDTYVENSQKKVDQRIENGLQEINTSIEGYNKKLIEQLDFTALLIRALTNKDEDVKYNILEEIIKEYSGQSYVDIAYNCRGNVLFDKKKYDVAISDYTKAIELNPMFADAYYNRGNAYVNIKKYTKAIKDYTKAIALNPKGADFYLERGNVYAMKKDYDQSIADYARAIDLNPNCANYYVVRGSVYAMKKDYDQSIADYARAIDLNPNCANYYVERGSVYAMKKDFDKAKIDYMMAIELEPSLREMYLSQMEGYMKKVNKGKAKYNKKRTMRYRNEEFGNME